MKGLSQLKQQVQVSDGQARPLVWMLRQGSLGLHFSALSRCRENSHLPRLQEMGLEWGQEPKALSLTTCTFTRAAPALSAFVCSACPLLCVLRATGWVLSPKHVFVAEMIYFMIIYFFSVLEVFIANIKKGMCACYENIF